MQGVTSWSRDPGWSPLPPAMHSGPQLPSFPRMLLLPWVRMPVGTVRKALCGLWDGYGISAVYPLPHLGEYRQQLELGLLPCKP